MRTTINKDILYAVTANKLHDGLVVYYNQTGWVTDIQNATVSHDGAKLLATANQTIKLEDLISIELIKIEQNQTTINATSMRERIKSSGPTIHYSDYIENNNVPV